MANYPISNVSRRVVYTGSAGVGPYSFSFEIIAAGDVDVYKNDTLLSLTTNYTVTINSNGTGSVTLVSAATGSDRITIVGARAIERTTDFVTGGDLFANTLNEEIDSQTIFVQQVAETAERSIKAPVTDPTNINMTLPSQTSRVGKTLAFDSDGNPIAGDPIGNWRGNWTTATSYQNRDLIKDTTNSNVYISLAAHTSTGSLPISTNADSAKWGLVVDAAAAGTSATNAAASASAASSSASSASTSASNASSSASSASTSATTATTQATNASNSATSASTSATNASNSATSASTSATSATNSASSATSSASTASTAASNASTSESNAATSATNASNSQSAAATSATNASNSASSASTSATNASNSATSANTAKVAAESARDSALAALDNFDDRYLGQKSTAPTLDNDGNALVTGALYFNTTTNVMNVYDGTQWLAAYASLSGALLVANNLSDLSNAGTARTNLGLSSATQAEMEAGTEANLRSVSPLRVKQAISALAPVAFPTGTKLIFAQTAAPTGWTKDTTHDNKALRVVTGTAASGGTVGFTTAFASKAVSGTVDNTTLSSAQLAAHNHTYAGFSSGGAGGALGGGGGANYTFTTNNSSGGGGAHNHSFTGTAIDLAVQYVDVIIATKN
jgi:hypothetical protein